MWDLALLPFQIVFRAFAASVTFVFGYVADKILGKILYDMKERKREKGIICECPWSPSQTIFCFFFSLALVDSNFHYVYQISWEDPRVDREVSRD